MKKNNKKQKFNRNKKTGGFTEKTRKINNKKPNNNDRPARAAVQPKVTDVKRSWQKKEEQP